jgi:hypothetical protein
MKAKAPAPPARTPLQRATLPQRLFTAKEAAHYLGYQTAWPVRSLAWAGELPTVQLSKRRIAFDVADLDHFIETRKSREIR